MSKKGDYFLKAEKWWRKNYLKLAPKKRKIFKKHLEVVANSLVCDNIDKRGYNPQWKDKYKNNIKKAQEVIDQEMFELNKKMDV